MAGNQASRSGLAGSCPRAEERILRARRVSLDPGDSCAGFEGARLFLDGIRAVRSVPIAYEAGGRR